MSSFLTSLLRRKKGEIFVHQGEPQRTFVAVASGKIERWRTEEGARHLIDEIGRGDVMGSLHVLDEDAAHAEGVAAMPTVVYEMPGQRLKKLFAENPAIALGAIRSLGLGVRSLTNHLRTPLLEQTSKQLDNPVTGLLATSAGALIESYYRAGLNTLINYRLAGKDALPKSYFPNMHVQIPVRIVYINGIKMLRKQFEPLSERMGDNNLGRFGVACLPGLIMTPLSSILEASNASQSKEPIATRWRHGLVPRAVREVIFAIGFNQLSDYFEERVPDQVRDSRLRAALGSLQAGWCAGILSHHPHNMSTLKLLRPELSYLQVAKTLIEKSVERRVSVFPPNTPRWLLNGLAVLLPQGILLRTLQISGTFIIVNSVYELAAKKV